MSATRQGSGGGGVEGEFLDEAVVDVVLDKLNRLEKQLATLRKNVAPVGASGWDLWSDAKPVETSVGQVQDYLSGFPDDATVRLVVRRPRERRAGASGLREAIINVYAASDDSRGMRPADVAREIARRHPGHPMLSGRKTGLLVRVANEVIRLAKKDVVEKVSRGRYRINSKARHKPHQSKRL